MSFQKELPLKKKMSVHLILQKENLNFHYKNIYQLESVKNMSILNKYQVIEK